LPRIEIDLEDVRQLPAVHRATIPDDYLDAMGHMNVMWYTHLFSCGMGGVLRMMGLDWDEIAAHHGGTFALESHTRYLSEVRIGQTIEVHARIVARSEKRFHVMQFMPNLDKQDVAATFETVNAYVDLRERRMAVFPETVAEKLDALIESHQGLGWPAPVSGGMAP
jgi:acyl-CoA thioester hydrolase